jgi:ribosomal protein L37E
LFAETEGFLTAIEDQVVLTRNYKKYILKQPDTDELCRRCGKESVTIQHLTAACEQLAPTEYVKRHDGLAKIIHQKLAVAAELIDDKSLYYKYTPANVLENENFKLYWNRSILMDKPIPFNRPDITFMNKKTKKNCLIDIAVPNTRNLAKTITDKQNKYQELANEIFSMWKQKAAQVISIVISSTGAIPKSLSQSLARLNLHPNTHIQLQKSVIRGTCSIARNILNYK